MITHHNDVIVVEDRVDMQCVRHVHWMANAVPGVTFQVPSGEWVLESGVWHLRWEGPYRGMIDVPAACAEGKFRRLVVWSLDSGKLEVESGKWSVRVALFEAAMEFERLFGGRAEYGFMRRLPKGAEHGMEVGDLILLEAEWMLERCVAVGCRGS